MKDKIIGIIGGAGPYAGFDLSKKILDNTKVVNDYDHIPQISLSFPASIPDRTAFLTKKSDNNPAYNIAEIIGEITKLNANIIGIACNQAHSPSIYNIILEKTKHLNITLVNMIESTAQFVDINYKNISKVGVLGRTGTYVTNIYEEYLSKYNIEVIDHGEELQSIIDNSISDENYGIKKYSNPAKPQAIDAINLVIDKIINNGAELIILGCTEIPLITGSLDFKNIPTVDPTLILARALIKKASPKKLKAYNFE